MHRIFTRTSILAGLALVASLGASPPLEARASYGKTAFDGSWSVSIITDSGSCDRASRYRIRISNGAVSYDDANGPQIAVSGRVNPRGNLSVTVGRGEQKASGTGRLSRDTGAGRWTGRSSTQQCSGRWEAERRE